MVEKRKRTISDFFTITNKRIALANDERESGKLKPLDDNNIKENISDSFSSHESRPLPVSSEQGSTSVPGLSLHEAFVTPTEEIVLLDFLNDTARCTWRNDLSRRSMHFGGTYCLFDASTFSKETGTTKAPKPKVLEAPMMPPELDFLLDRFSDQGIFAPGQRPQYCIVNEYHGNLGISPHVENFSFGEPVVGLSLLGDVDMRFIELSKPDGGSVRSGKAAKAEKTGKVQDVRLPGRSLMVMRGKSRWEWQHGIMRSKKGRGPNWKRVSLTFRWKEGG